MRGRVVASVEQAMWHVQGHTPVPRWGRSDEVNVSRFHTLVEAFLTLVSSRPLYQPLFSAYQRNDHHRCTLVFSFFCSVHALQTR